MDSDGCAWANVQMTRFSPPPHSHLFSCIVSFFLSLKNLPHILYIMHPSKYFFQSWWYAPSIYKILFLWLNDIFSINTYYKYILLYESVTPPLTRHYN
jgi:hypothetical protein